MQEIIRKYNVPRWYYTHINIPYGQEVRVEPDAFANSTRHRMRMIALSFASPNQTPYTHGNVNPNEHPSWTNRLLVDIGKSGCSDMNLVSGSLTSLCATQRRTRTIWGDSNCGRTWVLPSPYLLPRDEGLRVSVEYIHPQFEDGLKYLVGPVDSGEVTFIAKGFNAEDGYPAMLAGRCDSIDLEENRGNAVLMNSADLFNRGKQAIWLTEFCFKEIDMYYNQEEGHCYKSGNGFNFAWQVNPTNATFTQFMPQPKHIPTALLTPLVRTVDSGQESPVPYFFPPDTFLDPKQALGIRIGNTTTAEDVRVDICLIGEMEVK